MIGPFSNARALYFPTEDTMASATPHEADPSNPAYCVPSCSRCAEDVAATEDDLEARPAGGSLGADNQHLQAEVSDLRRAVNGLELAVARLEKRVADALAALAPTTP